MNRPSATIVIPIYNVGEYLDRCIESAVKQTYKNIRIILVDDGSTDKSAELCDSWAEKDERIKVIHKENKGVGQARNDGINEADSDYIFFLDGDDFFDVKAVESCICEAEKNKADIVMFGHRDFFPDSSTQTKEIKTDKKYFEKNSEITELLAGLFTYETGLGISICMKMFNLKIIKENNILFSDEREFVSEDACFLLECFNYVKSVSVLDENLYFYRKNEKSFSRRYKKNAQELNDKFLLRAVEICKKNNYPEKVIDRIKARYHMYVISALKQILSADLPTQEKDKEIIKIFENKLLSETVSKSVIKYESLLLRFFWELYSRKIYPLCKLLLKYKVYTEKKNEK